MELKFSKVGEEYTQQVNYETVKDVFHKCHTLSHKASFGHNDFLDKSLICIFNIYNAPDEEKMLTIDRISKEVVMGSLIGGQFAHREYRNPIFGGLVRKNDSEVGIYFKNFENDYEISLVNIPPTEIDKLDRNYIAQKITSTNDYFFYELFKLLSESQRTYLGVKKTVGYTLEKIVGEASE